MQQLGRCVGRCTWKDRTDVLPRIYITLINSALMKFSSVINKTAASELCQRESVKQNITLRANLIQEHIRISQSVGN